MKSSADTNQVKNDQTTNHLTWLLYVLLVILPIAGFLLGSNISAKQNAVENQTATSTDSAEATSESDTPPFPVMTIEQESNLSDDEKATLTERFIEPFFDYNQMLENDAIVATIVEAPENAGQPFIIKTVMADGQMSGFLFGRKGETYDYWAPGCFGRCEFTEEFTQTHPEVVEQYRQNIEQ